MNQQVNTEKSGDNEDLVFCTELKIAALECFHLMLDTPTISIIAKGKMGLVTCKMYFCEVPKDFLCFSRFVLPVDWYLPASFFKINMEFYLEVSRFYLWSFM
jgi:hypothetical protein